MNNTPPQRRTETRLRASVLATALLAGAALGLALPSVARADWTTYYCCNAWFSPGEGHDSSYAVCPYWRGNGMHKSDTAKGTLAWIDRPGNWIRAITTYEINMEYYIDPYDWDKKLYGQNSSTVGYHATLYGEWL